MPKKQVVAPESSAVRVALWRALHVLADPPPHVIEDVMGLKLIAPDEGWRERADMGPAVDGYRASIIARTRFVEDLVCEQAQRGITQYVILGAGIDTFAQRRPEVASGLKIFEIDQPGPQEWKRQRLIELGLGIPPWLRLVPVDFEAHESWRDRLAGAGFDAGRPAVVACTGVSMYLTPEAVAALLHETGQLARGSTLAMTFMLPLDLLDEVQRPEHEALLARARASGTPFLSLWRPSQMLALAREAGFAQAEQLSTADLTERYFSGRRDGLRPAEGESFLVATT